MRSQELDQRDLANMALPLHRSVVARNSGSFSFEERWVTRLAGPAINAFGRMDKENPTRLEHISQNSPIRLRPVRMRTL